MPKKQLLWEKKGCLALIESISALAQGGFLHRGYSRRWLPLDFLHPQPHLSSSPSRDSGELAASPCRFSPPGRAHHSRRGSSGCVRELGWSWASRCLAGCGDPALCATRGPARNSRAWRLPGRGSNRKSSGWQFVFLSAVPHWLWRSLDVAQVLLCPYLGPDILFAPTSFTDLPRHSLETQESEELQIVVWVWGWKQHFFFPSKPKRACNKRFRSNHVVSTDLFQARLGVPGCPGLSRTWICLVLEKDCPCINKFDSTWVVIWVF